MVIFLPSSTSGSSVAIVHILGYAYSKTTLQYIMPYTVCGIALPQSELG